MAQSKGRSSQRGRGSRSDDRRKLDYQEDEPSGGFMKASPLAWVSASISMLSLAGMIYSGVFAYASLHNDIRILRIDVDRNFTEDNKRYEHDHKMSNGRFEAIAKVVEKNHEFTVKAIERLDTTVAAMGSLNVKIGVLETKLESINDTLKRVEKWLDRTSVGRLDKYGSK